MTKEITPIQYADYKGWTLQNVTKHLRKKKDPLSGLPDVIEVKKYSRFYLLEVDNSLKVNSIEQAIKNFKKKWQNS
jgi:hypothetical protein